MNVNVGEDSLRLITETDGGVINVERNNMKNYICPNYCHINSSSTKERCPHCGSWMLDAGQDSEENREFLKKEAADRQLAYKDKFSSHQIV